MKNITNELKMKRLSGMLNKEQLEELKNEMPKEEPCCKQCNTPMPLVCWRYKIKHTLLSTKIIKPSPDDTNPPKDSEFHLADAWKDRLHDFIEKSGSSITDKQWQLRFFDFSKTRQENSVSKFARPVDTTLIFNAGQNEEILTNNKSLTKEKIDKMKIEEKETG